jgi:periplasmic protein TonB
MTPVAELEQTETQSTKIKEQAWQARVGRSAIPPVAAPSLFADVLLEVDSTEKRRRKWAAISTILLQTLFVGAVLMVPLMFTEALPTASQFVTFLVAPPPPPPPPSAAAAPLKVIRQVQSDILDGRLRAPGRIPQKIAMIKEDEAPPAMFSGGGVIGGVPGGELGGVIGGIISSVPHIAMLPKLSPPGPAKRMRISQGVSEGQKIYSPDPIYPRIARDARVQGVVILRAIISKTGQIQNLEVVSGHPMLVPAAIQAVKQWRYRPFLLTGEPVEVETGVTVTFHLAS